MTEHISHQVEKSRKLAQKHISTEKIKLNEQYFTPARIATIMAHMFSVNKACQLRVLDPCSGVGNLAAALYERADLKGEHCSFTIIEKDLFLFGQSKNNFAKIPQSEVMHADFFDVLPKLLKYDRIILNPPYSKIRPNSKPAQLCSSILNYTDTNTYSAFVSLCLSLLSENGELVAIIPRSFCNGPLFKGFRKYIFNNYYIQEFYSFDSRHIFSDSNVVQEVVIIKIGKDRASQILITHEAVDGKTIRIYSDADRVIFPSDPNKVFHIPLAAGDNELLTKFSKFNCTLSSIGMKASTGKVVDFRCKKFLTEQPNKSTVNLLYQDNIEPGFLTKVKIYNNKRARYIEDNEYTRKYLLQKGNYILIRRISFKESKTRIIAAPLLETQFDDSHIGVENHLNYIWSTQNHMTVNLCIALYSYLSTDTVDRYIRRFSGHTQINATDLNSIPIPDTNMLEEFYNSTSELDINLLPIAADRFFFGECCLD